METQTAQALSLRFIGHMNRRILWLIVLGILAMVLGVGGLVLFHTPAVAIISVFILFYGLMLALSAFLSHQIAVSATRMIKGNSQNLIVSTYMYGPVGKSFAKTTMGGNLFYPMDAQSTTSVEFKSSWYTPGLAATNEEALVYGDIAKGHAVVIVVDSGVVIAKVT